MKLPGIVVVGASGHAKVCIEVIRDHGRFEPRACVDANASGVDVLGVPVVGGDERLRDLLHEGCRSAFVAIGNNLVRERLAAELRQLGFSLPAAVHPSALISPTAQIGDGVLVMPRAVVNAHAQVRELAIINTGAIVEHDCIIGRAAHIAPGCILTGNVAVGHRTFMGAGTIARPGTIIGDDVTAGAGAVVVSDVMSGHVVVGVPARGFSNHTDS